jgi:hypothetical protein
LAVPHEESALIARLPTLAQVVSTDYEDPKVVRFFARIPPYLESEFKKYIIE